MMHPVRQLTATAVLAGTLLGVFFPLAVAVALDVPSTLTNTQAGITTVEAKTGVSLQTILAAGGLNTQKYAACTSTALLGDLANIFKNWQKILEDAINTYIQDFFRNAVRDLTKYAYCYLAQAEVHILGTGPSNPQPKCSIDIKSEVSATLKQLRDKEVQQHVIAGCISRIALKDTADQISEMMQTQGPFGEGTNWVTDWSAIPKTEADRAMNRFYTLLVNTKICPYMKNRVYAYFRIPKPFIDSPPPISGITSADAKDGFILRATCTLPDDFTPQDLNGNPAKFGGYLAMIDAVKQPQNNFEGLINMAQGEITSQTNNLIVARQLDAVSGGGLQSVADCGNRAPNGSCMAANPSKQTGGTLQIQFQSVTQAQVDRLNSQQQAVDDINTAIANRLFDLSNRALPLHIELGPDLRDPGSTVLPTQTPSQNPLCSNIQPGCVCVADDGQAQATFSGTVSDSINRATQVNNELFVEGTSQMAPGANRRDVLQAVCDRMNPIDQKICDPSPTSDTQIIMIFAGISTSIDIITPDNFMRTNGGQPIAACPN